MLKFLQRYIIVMVTTCEGLHGYIMTLVHFLNILYPWAHAHGHVLWYMYTKKCVHFTSCNVFPLHVMMMIVRLLLRILDVLLCMHTVSTVA